MTSAVLLKRYRDRIRTNPDLDRMAVSFQGNRRVAFFGWLKYREGFSAALAADAVERYTQPGDLVLDPFAGVGTAAFAARALQRRAQAIELLPVGVFAMEARRSAEAVRSADFRREAEAVAGRDWGLPRAPAHALRHIPITAGAFGEETERAIAGYRAYCTEALADEAVRNLFHLACLGVLEAVSFTRKDGQYLRWDGRAPRPGRSRFRKGRIEDFGPAVDRQLRRIGDDLEAGAAAPRPPVSLDLRAGSCLEILPELPEASVDLVVTSPPYCNRYDYTRTYALELVYLGLGADDVKRLRQSMLSCTVENADKVEQMAALYARLGRGDVPPRVLSVFERQAALHEALRFLERRRDGRGLNNANIPRMVRNYFLEMSFVAYELARLLRPGGRVVMVNDNVRYAGKEIPVDLILADVASGFGLEVEHIWTLARGKGNSSQQMGTYGRRELRKCVYVWRK